jgi:hypothetical protein
LAIVSAARHNGLRIKSPSAAIQHKIKGTFFIFIFIFIFIFSYPTCPRRRCGTVEATAL